MKLALFFLLIFVFNAGYSQSKNPKSIKSIDAKGLKEIIEKRNGKALFINFWATWCIPCREEFPDLVKLYNKYKKDRIEFITISIDYPDEIDSKILPFLKEMKNEMTTYVFNHSNSGEFINFVNKDWSGDLPATALYDKSGKQKIFFSGKKSYKDFEDAVKKVLK